MTSMISLRRITIEFWALGRKVIYMTRIYTFGQMIENEFSFPLKWRCGIYCAFCK